MATKQSDYMKMTDDEHRARRTTALCFDLDTLDKAGVTVTLNDNSLSFDITGGADVIVEFEKFLENYNYNLLEADVFLTAAIKIHNRVMLTRILIGSKEE